MVVGAGAARECRLAAGRSSEKAVRDILRRKRERRTGRVRVFRREQREEEPES